MEELGLRALHRRVAGRDVHRMLHVVTVLIEYGLPTAQTGAVPSGMVGIFWHQPILQSDPGTGRVVAAPRAHVLLETVALAAYQDSEFASLGRRFENCDPAWRQ